MPDSGSIIVRVENDLRLKIEELYRAFSAYPRPDKMHAAPERNVEQILKGLSSAPLRQLDAEVLDDYAFWAMTTVGDATDYLHFLPRIIELSTIEGGWIGLDPEIVASKLDYADWQTWDPSLRSAIRDVFTAAWARARLQHPDEEDASGWLWGIARLGMDIGSGLDGWLEFRTPDSMAQLAWFVMLSESLFENLQYDDWESVNVRRQIADWILGEPVEVALNVAASAAADSDLWMFECAEASRSALQQVLRLH